MNRIKLFPQFTPYELPVRWGHTFHSVAKALAKARTLHAHTVEIKDKPYSTGLLVIIKGGKNVVAT